MKITAEHLALVRAAVEPLNTPEWRARYIAGNFPRAGAVKDLDKRYRWDLFNIASRSFSHGTIATLYDYLNDDHIDTALRSIVPAFDIGGRDLTVAMAKLLQQPAAPYV